MPRSASYDDLLMEMLKGEGRASAYLNAAIEEGDHKLFLLALRNVVQAMGGVGRAASRSGLNRESLYRMLSEKGNPSIESLSALLTALGIRLTVSSGRTKPSRARRRAAPLASFTFAVPVRGWFSWQTSQTSGLDSLAGERLLAAA